MTQKHYHLPCFYCHIVLLIYLGVFYSLSSANCQAQSNKPWANPILIHGSSFANIMQQFYLTGNYEMMLKLTAKESRVLHGDSVILRYYQNMQFSYQIQLVSHSRKGNKYQLIYKSKIDATVVRLKVDIIVESDTARVILPLNMNESKHYYFGYL